MRHAQLNKRKVPVGCVCHPAPHVKELVKPTHERRGCGSWRVAVCRQQQAEETSSTEAHFVMRTEQWRELVENLMDDGDGDGVSMRC